MNISREALQDKALANLKLIFQIVAEINNAPSNDKKLIFEYALRFSLAELAQTTSQLREYLPDAAFVDKSAFLTPAPTSFDLLNLQRHLVALQKYLLATLL